MDAMLVRTITNVFCFVVMLVCIIYLFAGAVLNASRESRGEPKKKRTSFIFITLAIMAIDYFVFYFVSLYPTMPK